MANVAQGGSTSSTVAFLAFELITLGILMLKQSGFLQLHTQFCEARIMK
jgi:hypothetical protein